MNVDLKQLPEPWIQYIREVLIMALDSFASAAVPVVPETSGNSAVDGESVDSPPPGRVAQLGLHWNAMTTEEKTDFSNRVLAAIPAVLAAGAAIPIGLKLGFKALTAGKAILSSKKSNKKIEAEFESKAAKKKEKKKEKKDKKARKEKKQLKKEKKKVDASQ